MAAETPQVDRVEKPPWYSARHVPQMWGRLATCARPRGCPGLPPLSRANAAVGRLPIGRSLSSCPTKPLPIRVPARFFMKFRGRNAHSNRRQKSIVCPTALTRRVESREETREIACGGACRPQVFVANQLNFAGNHRHLPRCANAYLHPRTPNMRNHNFNIVADQNRLALAARHHEHSNASSGINSCWCE